jgi:protein-S-isoprenylcysteine O-methyltransferase Ste14
VSTSIAAIVLAGCYLGLAVGWRSWQQLRRTGDWGLRLARGGVLPRVASALMTIGSAASVLAPILDLRGALGPIGGWHDDGVRVAGLVVMAAGIAGVVWSQRGLRDSWRIGVDAGERTELVVDGPYALARNPIFTSMAVVAVGAALAVPNWVAVVGAALLVTGVELQVRRVEEPYLLAGHGASFRGYASRVGRFTPWIGRFHGDPVEEPT